jgi:hypothetical protein
MREQIIVIVAPDGSTRVETKGYQGSSCKDASAFIEKALGVKESETLKPEYHQSGSVARKLENRS